MRSGEPRLPDWFRMAGVSSGVGLQWGNDRPLSRYRSAEASRVVIFDFVLMTDASRAVEVGKRSPVVDDAGSFRALIANDLSADNYWR